VFQNETLTNEIIQSQFRAIRNQRIKAMETQNRLVEQAIEKENLVNVCKMFLNEENFLFDSLEEKTKEYLLLNSLYFASNLKTIQFNSSYKEQIKMRINKFLGIKDLYRQLFHENLYKIQEINLNGIAFN
jgi:hypothetical protein